jgi:glutathione S-transferase
MLTIHHLASSQSERIVWLCEELGLPYDLIRYERDPATRSAPPAYKALHPFGTSPAITDGDLVLGESSAIVDYLLARHGEGRLSLAVDDTHFADYLYWLHFANGSFIPSVMMNFALQMLGVADTDTTRMLRGRNALALRMSETRLAAVPYFAGDRFTAADIMMVAPLKGSRDLSGYPYIRAYVERMAERPAYRRAMQKAEPGSAERLD